MRPALSYAAAGVDIDRADKAKAVIIQRMKSTYRPGVIDLPWGFGGLYGLKKEFGWVKDPVLVAGTDGVGTKLEIAFAVGKHDTVGIDLVAMCVNDIVCQGAEPFLFLDYIATSKVEKALTNQIIAGVIEGCRQAKCALVGGETAQMPGFYPEGEYDLAGMALGMADRKKLLPRRDVKPGDIVIGLPSSGLHSNGYSLARKALLERGKLSLSKRIPELGRTLGEELLEPTRIYVKALVSMMKDKKLGPSIKGFANVTGGGLLENLPRVLPKGTSIHLDETTWDQPPVFDLIKRIGQVDEREMHRTFNCGIGMVAVVKPAAWEGVCHFLKRQGHRARVIGEVEKGKQDVQIS